MKTKDAISILLRLSSLYFFIQACAYVPWIFYNPMQAIDASITTPDWATIISLVTYASTGLLLWFFSATIAAKIALAAADDQLKSLDVMSMGSIVLFIMGLYYFVGGLTELVSLVFVENVGSFSLANMPGGMVYAFGIKILVGAAVMMLCKTIIRKLWITEGESSEVS